MSKANELLKEVSTQIWRDGEAVGFDSYYFWLNVFNKAWLFSENGDKYVPGYIGNPFYLFALVVPVTLRDQEGEPEYLNQTGVIIGYNLNGKTGNDADDPLIQILFEDGKQESYWQDELKLLNP